MQNLTRNLEKSPRCHLERLPVNSLSSALNFYGSRQTNMQHKAANLGITHIFH